MTDNPAIVERNDFVLRRLAVILNKYRGYRVTIEGHAVITRFADAKAAEKEQNEELLPLSKARAETVKMNLLSGVSKDRLNVTGQAEPAHLCLTATLITGGRTEGWSLYSKNRR